jgi:hypothetical protein
MNKKPTEFITASDHVDYAANGGPTPRGLESATMSMSDIPEDADLERVFNETRNEIEFARNLVLGRMAADNTVIF